MICQNIRMKEDVANKIVRTIGFLGSAIAGIELTRTNIINAKRLYQLNNNERAKIDDILIKLQDAEVYLTELKRMKERYGNDLRKNQ